MHFGKKSSFVILGNSCLFIDGAELGLNGEGFPIESIIKYESILAEDITNIYLFQDIAILEISNGYYTMAEYYRNYFGEL